ncbi:hypothetical protein [Ruegeria arenilitoris]|uniref:hypothetical protein n=1 Tax=Ruegeria arenilitoris TaxID=1173585 RepID=UPI00147EBF63|nr:hypothetical protein [Ruegeria arenilitoris]
MRPVQGFGDSVVLSLQEVTKQSHAKKFCLVMSLIGNDYDIFRIDQPYHNNLGSHPGYGNCFFPPLSHSLGQG